MALAVNASGTVTTDGTEQSLATPSTSQVYCLDVDVNAMAAGDIIELRVKKTVLTGGTVRTAWRASIGPSPSADAIIVSPPLNCPFGCTVTIKRIAGTDRAYPWSLMTLQ